MVSRKADDVGRRRSVHVVDRPLGTVMFREPDSRPRNSPADRQACRLPKDLPHKIGATRSRLIRQLLVESCILAAANCIGGCLFAVLGLKGMIAAIPPDTIPREVAISLRPATLLLALGVSVLATFVCGLAPALNLVRRDLQVGLAGSAKRASGGFSAREIARHSGRSRSRIIDCVVDGYGAHGTHTPRS